MNKTTNCNIIKLTLGSFMIAIYSYGIIINTIRVWLYHVHIRVWYRPYAYGIEHTNQPWALCWLHLFTRVVLCYVIDLSINLLINGSWLDIKAFSVMH